MSSDPARAAVTVGLLQVLKRLLRRFDKHMSEEQSGARQDARLRQTASASDGDPREARRSAAILEELWRLNRLGSSWRHGKDLDETARTLAGRVTRECFDAREALPRVPKQKPRDLDERQRIHELLKLELDASSSLNQRATTFFALLAGTAAAIIAFAGAFWLRPDERPISDEIVLIAGILAAIGLCCLVVGAIFGLQAIVPRSPWRQEARALLALHVVGAGARWHAAVLVDATDKQRVHNERKAWKLRWQTQLLSAGVGLSIVHVTIVVVAASV